MHFRLYPVLFCRLGTLASGFGSGLVCNLAKGLVSFAGLTCGCGFGTYDQQKVAFLALLGNTMLSYFCSVNIQKDDKCANPVNNYSCPCVFS